MCSAIAHCGTVLGYILREVKLGSSTFVIYNYFILANTCYYVTKYYLCTQNNKCYFFSGTQQQKAFCSF